MSFHVGQKVVCVRAGEGIWAGKRDAAIGGIYTVRSVFVRTWHGEKLETMLVNEITNPIFRDGMECGFRIQRFRPIVERKTDISIFTAMLDGVKQGERA